LGSIVVLVLITKTPEGGIPMKLSRLATLVAMAACVACIGPVASASAMDEEYGTEVRMDELQLEAYGAYANLCTGEVYATAHEFPTTYFVDETNLYAQARVLYDSGYSSAWTAWVPLQSAHTFWLGPRPSNASRVYVRFGHWNRTYSAWHYAEAWATIYATEDSYDRCPPADVYNTTSDSWSLDEINGYSF
jgi:hypothetical protein